MALPNIRSVYLKGEKARKGNTPVELAPTKWKNIQHVRTNNPSLHWFYFGEEYSLIDRRIPANQLPGGPPN